MTKKVCTLREASSRVITLKRSSPVSKKFTNLPLPPKKEDVVQKLHPIGQPTDGITVAAVAPSRSGMRTPRMRVSKPEIISGCWIGASGSAPRYSRIQRMPSPRTMWSASSMLATPGIALTCPPTTIFDLGDSRRTMRHISATLARFTMMEEMPTTSYCCATSSRANASRVGKSSTVQGLGIFAWIIMMPHER